MTSTMDWHIRGCGCVSWKKESGEDKELTSIRYWQRPTPVLSHGLSCPLSSTASLSHVSLLSSTSPALEMGPHRFCRRQKKDERKKRKIGR